MPRDLNEYIKTGGKKKKKMKKVLGMHKMPSGMMKDSEMKGMMKKRMM